MKIGSHVRNNGDKMLLGSIEEALSYHANCFMVYLGAPQNTIRKPLSQMNASLMAEVAKEANIELEDIIVHAPYIVNLARKDNDKFQFAVNFLSQELKGVSDIGCKYLVLHPGSHTDCSTEEAIGFIAKGINEILDNTKGLKSVIAIETMAGKGNEMGRNFEELRDIISLVNDKNRIAVCFDTCHVNDAGYDLVNNYEEVFKKFDEIVDLKYLKVFHINDSKNILGSHKDRHENFGFGTIGFDTLMKVINDERFESIPKILETPYVASLVAKETYPPYYEEIEMIKKGVFNPHLKEDVIKHYE